MLLAQLGIYFQVMLSNAREKSEGSQPDILVIENAMAKAESILRKKVTGVIIGADTSVVLDDQILGKPKDIEDAISTLKKLMGKWHRVYTGCVIIDSSSKNRKTEQFVVKSEVFMDTFNEDILRKYVDTMEPMDKAGSYAIQGVGAFLIKEIRGSYSNVIGLPINELVKSLLKISAIGV
ncbi:Maf family protein [Desulfothermus okinawensis JCM 13304]